MPLSLHPSNKQVYVIEIPSDSSLGRSDADFSNINHWLVDMEGNHLCNPMVQVFANGKLGTLKGGLLHLSDARSVLSKEDLCDLAMEDTSVRLTNKRTFVAKGLQ